MSSVPSWRNRLCHICLRFGSPSLRKRRRNLGFFIPAEFRTAEGKTSLNVDQQGLIRKFEENVFNVGVKRSPSVAGVPLYLENRSPGFCLHANVEKWGWLTGVSDQAPISWCCYETPACFTEEKEGMDWNRAAERKKGFVISFCSSLYPISA